MLRFVKTFSPAWIIRENAVPLRAYINYRNMDIYIKQAAKRHGLTLREVMTRADYVSVTSFSRAINNPESMTLRRLERIADAIGCPVAEFFVPADDEQGAQDEQNQLCPWCGKPIRVQLEQGEDSAFRTK